jgi:hypothetical protein
VRRRSGPSVEMASDEDDTKQKLGLVLGGPSGATRVIWVGYFSERRSLFLAAFWGLSRPSEIARQMKIEATMFSIVALINVNSYAASITFVTTK